MSRNLRVIEDNHIIIVTSNSDQRGSQRNGTDIRNDLLDGATAIIEGECDQRAMFITDTVEITTSKRFAIWFISLNVAPLIKQAIDGCCPRWMRMHEHELVTFTHNLGMKSGDNACID